MALLTVRELSVSFETRDGKVRTVNDGTFSLEAGKVQEGCTTTAPLFHPVAPSHAARCHLIA